jgi:primosomal protein DnaI
MKELKQMIEKKDLNQKLMINFNQALKEEEFKSFIDTLGLSYEELAKYTSILQESKEEYMHCKNCKSILACQNKIMGYAYLPHVKNNSIIFNYQMCKYLQEQNEKNKYLNLVYTFDIPEEIRYADIKNIDKSEEGRFDTIKYILNFIKKYPSDKHQKGLYLHGNFGCGKTYLISAMLNELAKKNIESSIVFWPEYLRDLKTSFNNNEEFKEKFNRVKEAPILLIDDIGAENMTSWSRDEILCPILQYRMDQKLPTFLTSNLDIEALEKHLSISKDGTSDIKARRIIERIKQLTNDQEMISKNLRK